MNINALGQVYPHRDHSWTMHDVAIDITTMLNQQQDIADTFKELQDSITRAHNISQLIPYAGIKDVVIRDALGSDMLMNSSTESLASVFQSALLAIKNFFLKLWANVVAFFKRLFDSNSKARSYLYKSMITFDRARSATGDANVMNAVVFIPPFKETVDVITNLEILYNDSIELSKALSLAEAAMFKKGITLFGYTVQDGVIYDTNVYVLTGTQTQLSETDWTIDGLKQVTTRVCKLCTSAANLNAVKDSLENDVKAATRTIDRYLAIGNNEGAEELQQELNNKSLRASYVFKCAVVFQSYVTQLNGILTDVWANVLAANGSR